VKKTDDQTQKPTYPIESVDNALRLLLLIGATKAVRVTDVSETLGVAVSTAHRLLAMFQYYGLVRQDPDTKCYLAGPALISLSFAAMDHFDLRSAARPVIERLAGELDETVHLAILNGSDVLFIDSVESTKALRVSSRTGRMLPAHCTSSGQVLLSSLDPADFDLLYPREQLVAVTKESITTREELKRVLARTRKRGYATQTGQSEEGVSSVAVAVPDTEGRVVGAIGVAAPTSRFAKALETTFATAALAAADEVFEPLAS
jgi:IclR family acetate operon transcriptional repressor